MEMAFVPGNLSPPLDEPRENLENFDQPLSVRRKQKTWSAIHYGERDGCACIV